ncbi:hypothetical protein E2C01_085698 [Portunus trituberculatus]|uniref:Uncharacterized protein n=1 Tax=Portunus trituberculatus TaxID=210409 RepID=A0A5B7IYT9_PORTR|nr:hypothetical protein [Portunus trituberculatus]
MVRKSTQSQPHLATPHYSNTHTIHPRHIPPSHQSTSSITVSRGNRWEARKAAGEDKNDKHDKDTCVVVPLGVTGMKQLRMMDKWIEGLGKHIGDCPVHFGNEGLDL